MFYSPLDTPVPRHDDGNGADGSGAAAPLQRPYASRPAATFGNPADSAWTLIERFGDDGFDFDDVRRACCKAQESSAALSMDESGLPTASASAAFGSAGVSADHTAAVFSNSNGLQSIRATPEYGTLDPLTLLHTVAAAKGVQVAVHYPHSAKGLPRTSADAAMPLARTAIAVSVDGARVGSECTVARRQCLDMLTGVVTCDEYRPKHYGAPTGLHIRTERFASVARPGLAAVRITVSVPTTVQANSSISPSNSSASGKPTAKRHTVAIAADIGFDAHTWRVSSSSVERDNSKDGTVSAQQQQQHQDPDEPNVVPLRTHFAVTSVAGVEPRPSARWAVDARGAFVAATGTKPTTATSSVSSDGVVSPTTTQALPVRRVVRQQPQQALPPGFGSSSPAPPSSEGGDTADRGATSSASAANPYTMSSRGGGGQYNTARWTSVAGVGRQTVSASVGCDEAVQLELIYALDGTSVESHRHIGSDDTQAAPMTSSASSPWEQQFDALSFESLRAEHAAAMRKLWGPSAARLDEANAPLLATQLTAADPRSAGRDTAALRHASYVLLANAAGVGRGVPPTAAGLTANGLGGVADLTTLMLHGEALVYTSPPAAERLLTWLVSLVPVARLNAANQHVRGCLFPGQTVDGTDIVPYFVNSAARIHVSSDAALFAAKYVQAAGGLEKLAAAASATSAAAAAGETSLLQGVLSLVLETALAVIDFGTWDAVEGVFRLDSVTGPDEYNPLVDGHVYTHVVARAHLRVARAWLASSSSHNDSSAISAAINQACADAGVARQDLLELIDVASSSIVVARDDVKRVYQAHSCFDRLPPFPAASTATGGVGHPLSMHVHPLVIYRHKVVQVPDVLLAQLAHPNQFFAGELDEALAYYAPLCSRDVPWSLGVEAAAALRVKGDRGVRGAELLQTVLRLTLDHGVTGLTEGLRLAPLAAAWYAVAVGVLGFDDAEAELKFSPVLPIGWNAVRLPFVYRGASFTAEVGPQHVEYRHCGGAAIRIRHGAERVPVCLGRDLPPVRLSRPTALPVTPSFDGAVILLDAIVAEFHEANFEAWRAVLNDYFDVLRQHFSGSRASPPASPQGSCEDLSGLAIHGSLGDLPELTLAEYARTFLGPTTADHGQMRYAGVEQVLRARNIELPVGTPNDAVVSATRFGLANAKLVELQQSLRDRKLCFVPGALELIEALHRDGVRIALVTFSRSAPDMLAVLPDVSAYVTTTISGKEARALHIGGRPHADLFTTAAQKMHLLPRRCVVIGSQLARGFAIDEFAAFAGAINVRWAHDVDASTATGSSLAGRGNSNGNEQNTGATTMGPPINTKTIAVADLPRSCDDINRLIAH